MKRIVGPVCIGMSCLAILLAVFMPHVRDRPAEQETADSPYTLPPMTMVLLRRIYKTEARVRALQIASSGVEQELRDLRARVAALEGTSGCVRDEVLPASPAPSSERGQ